MNKNNASLSKTDRLKIYKIACAVAVAVTALVSAAIFFTCSDGNSRYLVNSPAVYTLYAIIGADVLLAVSAPFLFRGKTVEVKSIEKANLLYIPICLAVIPLLIYIGTQLTANGFGVQTLLIAISACFVQIYFASEFFPEKKTVILISGYCAMIFCITVITKLYFDNSVQMNAPLKLFTQFSAIGLALSILSDLRILTGKCGAGQYWLSKILFITISIPCFICAIEEMIFNAELYSTDYIIFPTYLFACAVFSTASPLISTISENKLSGNVPSATVGAESADEKQSSETDGQ